MLSDAEDALAVETWDDAIIVLQDIRATNPDFEHARIASLFCDAYVGRGLQTLAGIRNGNQNEKEMVGRALSDFEAGAVECPKRIDLQDQAARAAAYLQALDTPKNDYDTVIQFLKPLVSADANYVNGNARKMLYTAYLWRGDARRDSSDIVGALGDYEAALALNVVDSSEAQTRRAELLLAFSQQPPVTPEPAATTISSSGSNTGKPTPEPPVRVKYGQPQLLSPEDDVQFAGRLYDGAVLEWESVAGLAPDEYYDLTIMHIFADQPKYWGLATTDTRVQLAADIGVDEAGGNRFYWWVTVRKANTAPNSDSIDLPVSLRSEARTFVWTP
jgi:tetratricopeptide (TPR) repeat protein